MIEPLLNQKEPSKLFSVFDDWGEYFDLITPLSDIIQKSTDVQTYLVEIIKKIRKIKLNTELS